MVTRRFAIRAAALAFCAAGCKPDLGTTAELVTSERVLAVRSEPPEAALGTSVHFLALVAGPEGTIEAPPLSWSFCQAPKPLDENNVVATSCLTSPTSVVAIGTGPTADGIIPDDACQRFGPDPPPQKAGDPPLRPRDPDVTGGFYQPVRVDGGGDIAIGLPRIQCNLPNASIEVQAAFRMRYTANQNPMAGTVSASVESGQPVSFDALPHGKPVRFRYEWEPSDAEPYVLYDLTDQTLKDRTELLRVSFYTNAGKWMLDRVAPKAISDSFVENFWTTPEVPGTYHLWFVLRDNRGGVAYSAQDVTVQ